MNLHPTTLWGGAVDAHCLLDMFEQQAAAHPGDIAVVDEDDSFTYAELLSWTRGVAQFLVDTGVEPGDTVGVAGPRGAPAIAAMLGTMTAGAAYLPLDSAYPARRLAFMLSDSRAKLLLHSAEPPSFDAPVPVLPIPGAEAAGDGERVPCAPDLPVYVIYTSGSTGRPKGVALPHGCVDVMAHWQRSHSKRPDLRTAQFAPLNFDVSFQEVLGTLCGGGTLVVLPEQLRQDPFTLLDWLRENRIERLFLPYVALQMLAVAAAHEDSLDGLALLEINVAGEQLVCTSDIRELFERLPQCRLNNHYGQSESAMVSVHTLSGPSRAWPALPPIGGPLPGCELLIDVLDPAEPDVGELLVAGAPMSLGYLNRPELNTSRYIDLDHPTPRGHSKAFRTGDLVRVSAGEVVFLTRLDKDVKIRGYRMNLLEVEAYLLEQSAVTAAVCVVLEGPSEGSRAIHAAVTLEERRDTLDTGSVYQHLRSVLPEPYLPASITALASFPRTPSGKVDRDAVADVLAARLFHIRSDDYAPNVSATPSGTPPNRPRNGDTPCRWNFPR